MSLLNEIAQIIKVATLSTIPLFHTWRILAVIEYFTGNGTYVDNSMCEPERLYLLQIIVNGVFLIETSKVGFGIKPHQCRLDWRF